MTTVLDLQALQAAAGIAIPLAVNVRVRSGSVTSEAVRGFSDVRAVELVVRVPVLRGHPAPSMTVTVQKSANGSDWTTAHAFTFTATGDDSFTLEAPDDYLRVVCAPAGGLVEAVVASVVASIVTVDAPAGESPGGGSQPIGCLLEVFPLDVHDAGSNPCKWTNLFDNAKDFNALDAIPAGLGLTFAFDGSSATIATTEAGTWAFSLGVDIGVQDATWTGVLLLDINLNMGSQIAGADFGSLRNASVCEVLSVSAGYSLAPKIDTRDIATNDPLNADVYLNIVRLA